MSNWRRIALPFAAAAILLVLSAAPGDAATTTTSKPSAPTPLPPQPGEIVNSWALAPASTNDPTQTAERSSLSYSAPPGGTLTDAVTLFNFSNVQLAFKVYATDAFNNAEGQFDVLRQDQKTKDVGSWITLPQRDISLPPNSQATFPITVKIPATASPGDHAGAILASSAAIGQDAKGNAITVDRRTGSRVYIRVAGPLSPELAITKVKTTYHASLNPFSGRNDVSYRVENQGNVRLAGKHKVSAKGLLGLGGKGTQYADLPELLPGQGVTLHASFKGLPATFLNFANAKVDPNDAEGKTLKVISRGAATIAIPWTIIALAIIIGFSRYAQRAYQRHRRDQQPEVKPQRT